MSYIQSAQAAQASVGSIAASFGSSVTTGNLLVVTLAFFGSGNFSSTTVTDTQGNTYSKSVDSDSGNLHVSIWAAVAGSSGSNTITCTPNIGNRDLDLIIAEYGGGYSATPDASAIVTNPALAPVTVPTLTTTAANDLIAFGAYDGSVKATFSVSADFTIRQNTANPDFCAAAYGDYTAATAGSHGGQTVSCRTGDQVVLAVAAFSPSGGGVQPNSPIMFVIT